MQTEMVEGDCEYPYNQEVGWKLHVWLLLK